jgi:hypothetical protein
MVPLIVNFVLHDLRGVGLGVGGGGGGGGGAPARGGRRS